MGRFEEPWGHPEGPWSNDARGRFLRGFRGEPRAAGIEDTSKVEGDLFLWGGTVNLTLTDKMQYHLKRVLRRTDDKMNREFDQNLKELMTG